MFTSHLFFSFSIRNIAATANSSAKIPSFSIAETPPCFSDATSCWTPAKEHYFPQRIETSGSVLQLFHIMHLNHFTRKFSHSQLEKLLKIQQNMNKWNWKLFMKQTKQKNETLAKDCGIKISGQIRLSCWSKRWETIHRGEHRTNLVQFFLLAWQSCSAPFPSLQRIRLKKVLEWSSKKKWKNYVGSDHLLRTGMDTDRPLLRDAWVIRICSMHRSSRFARGLVSGRATRRLLLGPRRRDRCLFHDGSIRRRNTSTNNPWT